MNIIKMYMNNVIILILAVRICEDSDTRGSDKRGYTVQVKKKALKKLKMWDRMKIKKYGNKNGH